MLVYQQNRNVLPLFRERVERGLDFCVFGFIVHDQEILLRVWRIGDMLAIGLWSTMRLRRRRR